MHRLSTKAAAVLATAALVAGLAAGAGAAEARRSRHSYGLVGFTTGQAVRLNVVNTLPPGPVREDVLPPSPIRVRLSLYDAAGRLLASRRAALAPGESISLDFTRPGGTDVLPAVQVRAQVDVMLPPGPIIPPDPCASTLEIVDTETARTSLLLSPAAIRGFNPQPDPPGEQ